MLVAQRLKDRRQEIHVDFLAYCFHFFKRYMKEG